MYEKFSDDICKFNDIYRLPNHENPQAPSPERISQFMDILQEEIQEGQEIQDLLRQPERKDEALVALSDWLGDIIVYAASEARRAGIPLAHVLQVIMQSNFSKLGEDGEPIYDERGKVMKGPNYWAPEDKIAAILASRYQGQADA